VEVKETSKLDTEVAGQEVASQGKGARRQYTNRGGKSGHVSPAIVEKYLGGIHYPADRHKLITNAESKGAPNDVLSLLHKLPEKTYKSPIDITKEIGKIE
jgi:hypothetical protein